MQLYSIFSFQKHVSMGPFVREQDKESERGRFDMTLGTSKRDNGQAKEQFEEWICNLCTFESDGTDGTNLEENRRNCRTKQ